MFAPTSVVCLICFHFNIITAYTNDCVAPNSIDTFKPDYYWRDYRGIVPSDAIEGGQDEMGNTTYIGKIVSPLSKGIIPAIIYPGKREAVGTAVGKTVSSSLYVQILCTTQKNRFEWRPITVQTMHLLTDYHLIVGGMEENYLVYIGRANSEDEVKIGKVFHDYVKYRGLKLPLRGGSEYTLLDFEILTYPRYLR